MEPVKSLIRLLVFLCVLPLSAQGLEAIEWHPDRRLTWADFKGRPFKTSWEAATTASSITYAFSSEGTDSHMEVDMRISTHFYPTKSWYKPELCDSLTLSHEQVHFDIVELHARKMRDIVAKTTFTGNVKEEVKEIYRDILQELRTFQNRYDHETNFSRDVEKQLLWNKMVARALRDGEEELP